MSETIEERIRRHAPGAACGYYLELHQNDGTIMRYPKVGAFSLKPFCRPSGTPFGTFNLFFVRYPADQQPLPSVNAAEPYPRVQIPFTKKSDMDRALSEFRTSEESNTSTLAEADTEEVTDEDDAPCAATRISDLEVAIASTPAMITARADFEKQRMAMELAENNQALLNRGTFSRDAAEALALNRAYRREAQVTIESHSHLIRRTAEEVQSHWVAYRTAQEAQIHGMRLIKEQLEMFAKPAPPPPPPDYTPAIVEGLKTLRDFGVAMIQAKAGIPVAVSGTAPLSQQSATAQLVADEEQKKSAKPAETPAATSAMDPKATSGEAAASPPPAEQSPEEEMPASAELKETDSDVDAGWTSLLDQWSDGDAAPSAVKPVAPIAPPSVPTVTSVLRSLPAKDAREEAARLWRALAETSELEAMFALMSPEQLQAFLKRFRQRAAQRESGVPSRTIASGRKQGRE